MQCNLSVNFILLLIILSIDYNCAGDLCVYTYITQDYQLIKTFLDRAVLR